MFSDMKARKLANAIVYFLDKDVCNLGTTKLMKLLFYADKEHLNRFGVPIFKHLYSKQQFGPVPMFAYALIQSMNQCETDDVEEDLKVISEYIDADSSCTGPYSSTHFSKKKEFETDYFSKSELEVLEKISEQFKNHTANEISKESHELSEYSSTSDGSIINFHKMVDDDSTREYVKYWESYSV